MHYKKTPRIVMAVTNDLVTDRRVLRHAETLREAGYEVVLVGRKEVPTKHRRGWRFYWEFNMALQRKLRELKPDIVWANDTDTLLGGWLAVKSYELRVKKVKLVMDAHELFPEVPEIQGKPLVKWVWRTLERNLMPKCDALLTVCDSIAEYYRLQYGVSMATVRNLPVESGKWKVESDAAAPGLLSTFHFPLSTHVLLYQGRVNLGRGVDWAIDALEELKGCRLVVAGDGDLLEEMKEYALSKPWRERVVFTGRLAPHEMEQLTPQADVGLVMLEDRGLSYHYALPNRIGDFVAAGVPMVVSDLPEMAAVVRRYKVGEVIRGVKGSERGVKGSEWGVKGSERGVKGSERGVKGSERGVKGSEWGVKGSEWGVKGSERTNAQALAEAVRRVLAREWREEDFEEARRDMDWNKEKFKLIKIVNDLCCTTSF